MATTAPDADVIVVGAGAAGAAAVLEAHAAGVTVIGIDDGTAFGGTTAISGGGMAIPGTALQAALGIDDSPDIAYADIVAAGGGEADEAWARRYVDRAATDVYEWLVGLGVRFDGIGSDEASTVPRRHQPAGLGRGLMDALWAATGRLGAADRWRFATRLVDLVVEGGRGVGARVEDGDGGGAELRAGAVVLTTGGFAGDHATVIRHVTGLRGVERVLVGGGPGALGSGHAILAAHGGRMTHEANAWSYVHATPDPWDATGLRGLVIRRMEAAIWVNRAGRRFHDESRPGPLTATPAVLAQDPPTCWAILDRPALLGIRIADPRFRDGAPERIDELVAASPYIHVANGPEALGLAAGIDPGSLARTVAGWDALVASGASSDPETGRPLEDARPLSSAPLYAVQLFPLVRKNLGGIRTDGRCRVVDAAGAPIPGVYAAGELAGFGGGHLSGRGALEGIMIGGSFFSGRIAGAWAAHDAGAAAPEHLGQVS